MGLVAANTPRKESRQLAEMRKKQLRMTQDQLAEELGLSTTTYRNYEYHVRPPDWVLARVQALTVQETRGLYGIKAAPMGKLRVYGSAGAGDAPGDTADGDEIYAPIEFCRPDYGGLSLTPTAVSMLPYLHPSDTLVFKDWATPRLGKIMAVRLPDEAQPVVKKIAFDGRELVLRSFNSAYADVPFGEARAIGYLVGIISLDGEMRMGPEEDGIDEAYIERHLRSRLPDP